MRSRGWLFAALLHLINPTSAVYLDEAYRVDYHYSLLGIPQPASTFFHQPVPGSRASLLYAYSEKSVLGAINPGDGSVVWRQRLQANGTTTRASIAATEGQDIVVSAIDNTVTAWSATDGKLAWDQSFTESQLVDCDALHRAGSEVASFTDGVFIAMQGAAPGVKMFRPEDGTQVWTYKDTSGDIPFRLAVGPKHLYYISLQSTMIRGLKIKVTVLDYQSGIKAEEYILSSEGDVSSATDISVAGSRSGAPIIAWLNSSKTQLKVNVLGAKPVTSLDITGSGKHTNSFSLHAPHSFDAPPLVLIHFMSSDGDSAGVYRINIDKGSLEKSFDLPKHDKNRVFSSNLVDNKLLFTQISETDMLLISSESPKPLAQWPVSEFGVHGLHETPTPLEAVSEVVVRSSSSYAVRSAVLLSTGDVAMMRNGESSWTRPEALAGIIKAEWIELQEHQDVLDDLEIETKSNLAHASLHRFLRHAREVQKIYDVAQVFVQTISDTIKSFAQSDTLDTSKYGGFGFNKMVVVATENGRLVALQAGQLGRVFWNIRAKNLASGEKWDVKDVGPLFARVLSLGQHPRSPGNTYPDWFNSTSFENPEMNFVDSSHDPAAAPTSKGSAPLEVVYSIKNGLLQGSFGKSQLWQFHPRPGEKVLDVVPIMANEPVASIGKALADRSVLYKYLNPNAAIVSAVNKSKNQASFYVLDAVSGNVLYTSTHYNIDTSRPITSAISENWFTYSYTTDASLDSTSKGYQLVVGELYESQTPNDRGPLRAAKNISAVIPATSAAKPYTVSQVFHIPEEISSMAVTQTRQGITSRQLIVSLSETSSLVSIPRQALDPRRTVGKDPTSAQQMEEGLTRYMPMLDFDPRWYLNHREELIGIKKVITIPASLESTVLVFAYGLDIFGTRVTPSFGFDVLSSSFNKIQLLLTVVALIVAVFVVGPIVQRKQTNSLWQSV